MMFSSKIIEKLKGLKKIGFSFYPFLIIILVPSLLVINTIWNLRSFNRDANFLVRHQAISLADTIKPFLEEAIDDSEKLNKLLISSDIANEDILQLTLLKKKETEGFDILASSGSLESTDALSSFQLNQIALGLNQAFAGLVYDPKLQKSVWNVSVPVKVQDSNYLLNIKVDVASITEILDRTTKDSIIVLSILVAVTLALLANHFYFYARSLKAQELEELDRLKDEFISMAAHELRAPMTGLVGYLQLLRDKLTPSELAKINEDLDTLDVLTKDLNNLINDLLDVSRIEQGRLKVEVRETKVNNIIEEVIKTFTPLALEKDLKINFASIELPDIKSDPDRLRQVVTNLVSNSIKYTLQGEISIKVSAKSNQIEVEVRDTGIGIPASGLSNLFSKFHRIKDEKTQGVRGTGLGLWITKKIVEQLGGKIFAQSIYGTGTSVTFTIPL